MSTTAEALDAALVALAAKQAGADHLELGKAMDALVRQCELDPADPLGARVKMAICELYEQAPMFVWAHLNVRVSHDLACSRILAGGECDCQKTVKLWFEGNDESRTVH